MDKPHYLFDKSLIFSHLPFFADLNPFERKLIFDSLEIVEVKSREMIYRQGDPPDAFYGLISGRVEIFIERDGREELLEHVHRGKYFGFISLLTGENHSVSARALSDTVLAKIPKDRFAVILKHIPRLAIDLSRMLSRRLKRKDLHPKIIFESTIISVYGSQKIVREAFLYGLNLAFGLKVQTQKRVVLVDVSSSPDPVLKGLVRDTSEAFSARTRFFKSEDVLGRIAHTDKGFDVLRVSPDSDNTTLVPFLISLLTMLVNDYHYCIIHLPPQLGPDAYKVMAQSDLVHFLASADAEEIKDISRGLHQSGIWSDADFKKKISLIVLEGKEAHGRGRQLTCEQEGALFHQPVLATLPDAALGATVLDETFNNPYQKVMRRVTRQIGEVLVGLALGSGSAMGLSHIGVLKVLEDEDIPVDIVCGSSMGALVGALWCAGYSAREVEEIILTNKDRRYLFGIDDLTLPLRGLIKGKHIWRFLKKYLKDKTFCDVKRPFKVVACDCVSMKQVIFDSGYLVDAVLASISIPGVFEPYRIADHYYIDGGILNPLPTDILIESGAKKIISVNVLPSSDEIERTYEILNKKEAAEFARLPFLVRLLRKPIQKTAQFLRPNIFDVIVSSVQSIEYALAQLSSLSSSDVSLHPDMTAVSWAAFDNAADLIKRGEEEARLHLSEIKELVNRFD